MHESTASQNSLALDLADRLFPGFGFFGSEMPFLLEIPIRKIISGFAVTLRGPEDAQCMNLQGFVIYDFDGVAYDNSKIFDKVCASSIFENGSADAFFQLAVNGGLLHSEWEVGPRIGVSFFQSLPVGCIAVRNRAGIYGKRSKFLILEVDTDSESTLCFENLSIERKLSALTKLSKTVDVEIVPRALSELPSIAEQIRNEVLANLESISTDFGFIELCRFLPLYDDSPSLSDFERAICGAILLKLLGDRESIHTDLLSPLATVLNTTSEIELLELVASRLNSQWRNQEVDIQFCKHSIFRLPPLERKEELLPAIQEAIEVFQELGISIMICYGTLLGAVRDGAFIPHDDDIDMLIYDGSRSCEEAIQRRAKIINELLSRGHEVTYISSDKNFHAMFKGIELDFFICWKDGDRIILLMECFDYRGIDEAIIYPPSMVTLCQVPLNAPALPEAFLEERYGMEWKVPNRFHEWPWSID